MSRAFVRERDNESADAPPEIKVSPHPNRVTRRGLSRIEQNIDRIEAELRDNPEDTRAAWLRRDLRYWSIRHATAQLTEPLDPRSDEVTFGSHVKIVRDGHEPETVEIVGENESDPATGHVSWVAPLAVALMGGRPGETVTVGRREPPLEVEILEVENSVT